MKRNRWLALVFAIVLFGCGAVCGALAHRYFSGAVVSAKSAEDFRQNYLSEMKLKLKLNQNQLNQLEVILDDTKAKYKAVRDRSRPEMMKIKQEQISRVKSILTPGQVTTYERLIAEREQRFKEQEERERIADQKREAAHRSHATQ
jgi:hypothetical protein